MLDGLVQSFTKGGAGLVVNDGPDERGAWARSVDRLADARPPYLVLADPDDPGLDGYDHDPEAMRFAVVVVSERGLRATGAWPRDDQAAAAPTLAREPAAGVSPLHLAGARGGWPRARA